MAKKRPLAPPASPTDEWGIYDPAKAGMQALYSRLGRPILRASAASERRERKRASRPERPPDGVGMAIQEAKRRAGLISAAQAAPPPAAPLPEPVPVAAPVPVPVPVTVPVAVPVAVATAAPVPVSEMAAAPRKKSRTKAAKVTKRRQLGDAVVAAGARTDTGIPPPAAAPPPPPESAPAPPVAAAEPVPQRRAVRKPVQGRQTNEAAAPALKATPVIPPPSPRRPRGAVPLAAWAHAVSDSPQAEAKRSEAKGLWRGIFRIPSEVALVAYGRGCRIHRLVIETPADALADPF